MEILKKKEILKKNTVLVKVDFRYTNFWKQVFGGFQKMSIMVKKKSRASPNKKIALLVLKHVKTCLMRAQRAIFFNVGIKTPKKHYFLLTFLRVEC